MTSTTGAFVLAGGPRAIGGDVAVGDRDADLAGVEPVGVGDDRRGVERPGGQREARDQTGRGEGRAA